MLHVRAILDDLTRPTAAITDLEDRQRARLLASFTFALLGLAAISIISPVLVDRDYQFFTDPIFWTEIALCCVLGVTYGLSRTQYHRIGAWGLVIAIVVGIFVITSHLPTEQEYPNILVYLSISFFLASLLLSSRETLFVAGVCITTVLFLPEFVHISDYSRVIYPAGYLFTVYGLIVAFSRHRDFLEYHRQAQLEKSEKQNRAMLDAMPDLMFRLGRDGRYVDFQANNKTDLYPTEGGFIGRLVGETLPQPVANVILEHLQLTLATDKLHVFEYQLPIQGVIQNFEARMVTSGKNEVVYLVRNITERARMEAALDKERNLLRTMIDNIPDKIYFKDTHSHFTLINQAQAWALGAESPTTAIGQSDFDYQLQEQAQVIYDEEQRVMQTGEAMIDHIEYQPTREGQPRWLSITKVPVIGSNGRVIGLAGISKDITAFKLAEDALRESQERWQSLVEHIPGTVTHIDEQSTILFINRVRVAESVAQTIGKSLFEIVPAEYHEIVRQKVEGVFRTGEPDTYELKVEHPEDGDIWFRTQIAPVWRDGQVESLILISTDFTERKIAEEALRTSESRFRAMNDASPFGIFLTDANGDCLYTNQVYHQMTGLTFDEAIGEGWSKAIHPEERERVFTEWYDAARAHLPFASVMRYQHKNGSVVWVNVKAVRMQDGDALLGYVGSVEDITERKAAQDALSQERNLLRTVIDHLPDNIFVKDRKGDFTLSNLAHAKAAQSSPEKLIGKTAIDDFPAEAAAQFYSDDETIMQSRQSLINAERVTVNEDGNKQFVLTTKVPLLDSDNAVIGLIGISRDITERKQAEETLANERNLLRTLIDHLPAQIFVKDSQSRFIIINPGVLEDMGVATPDELIGKSDFDFFPEEVAREFYNQEQAIIQTGQPILNQEHPIIWPGESIRWISTTKVPLHNAENAIIGIVGFNQDITQRKQTEETLANERNLLRTLIDTMPYPVYVKDVESRFMIGNIAVAHGLGATTDSIVGKTDFNFHPQDIATAFYAEEQALLQSGTVQFNSEQDVFNQLVGEWECILSTKVPFYDSQGRIAGLVGVNHDITERKKTEEVLANERNLLRTLIDTIPEYVYVKDTQSRYILSNTAHAQSTGNTPNDMVGRSDFDFFPQELAETYYADEQEIFRTSDPLLNHEEVSVKEAENLTLMIASTSKVPLYNGSGEIVGLVGITRDVTEDKRVASQLEEARDQALESSRLKSEFLATMSHEIRTPMNGIIGMTELLLGTVLNDEQRDYSQIVLGEANSLLTVINDILDFSKIEAGKMMVEAIEFTLPNVVKRVVDMMKLRGADKGLSVIMTVAPDVPTFVCGDPNRLRQVLLNLMGNAVKFTRRGEVEIHVTLDKQQDDHHIVRFAIHDTGIGLSEVARRRLFQPFTQADGSTTRKYGGTGLGLVISKRLTELMGGEVGVDSEEGIGSTFWFTIQFAASAQEVAQADATESNLPNDKSEFLILIAEDDATNQSLALKQLRSLGYRARLVGNGVEAVDEIISHPGQYALILMDCQMPVMDGYEATRVIRAEEVNKGRHVPIVALTASAMIGVRERCIEAGMDDYLSKPVSLDALKTAIEQCLIKKE